MRLNWISAGIIGTAGACALVLTLHTPARAQVAKALVWLQTGTPGVAQVGHSNVSGTARSGAVATNSFRLGTLTTNGHYLRTDALGNGTWQPFALPLPYEGSGVENGYQGLFRILNNGSAAAIHARNTSGAFGALGHQSYGVLGEHGTSFNTGLLGNADNGVSGHNNNNPSYGYIASATTGVYGENGSLTGQGVRGRAYQTGGINYGVYGTTNSPEGYGVAGINLSAVTSATGVLGQATVSSLGTGVYGTASYIGVEGYANRPGNVSYGGYFTGSGDSARGAFAYGSGPNAVYGFRGNAASSNSGDEYGVYSLNNMGGVGLKSFRIDHPDDPANKYLVHYSSEGPDPMNHYSGTVTTDGKGFAWVELPSYYASVNKSPRYILTVIDNSDDFVLAKITDEIEENRFRIRTSKPGVKVSWVVMAERNDLWVKAHPPQAEVDKTGTERGRYQRPELYGLPREMGMEGDWPETKPTRPQ